MLFRAIPWWPNAFHVYDDDERIGIVNGNPIRINGKIDRFIWRAHNVHFFDVPGEYTNRRAAAEAIPRGPIHQPIGTLAKSPNQIYPSSIGS